MSSSSPSHSPVSRKYPLIQTCYFVLTVYHLLFILISIYIFTRPQLTTWAPTLLRRLSPSSTSSLQQASRSMNKRMSYLLFPLPPTSSPPLLSILFIQPNIISVGLQRFASSQANINVCPSLLLLFFLLASIHLPSHRCLKPAVTVSSATSDLLTPLYLSTMGSSSSLRKTPTKVITRAKRVEVRRERRREKRRGVIE